MTTVTKAREIFRFCLALVTVLIVWSMVSGIRASRVRHGCSAGAQTQRAIPQGQITAPNR